MTQEDILYTLALTKIDGIGDITAKKLINHLGHAKNVLESSKKQLQKIDGIGEILIEKIKKANTLIAAEQELKFIQSEQLKCFYYQNNDYPELLKQCIDAPVLLFGSGILPFQDRKIISIVGTRNMTPYGKDIIRKLLEDIAPIDPLIISGFAYGVDITAHTMALDLGLETIGILAHGLNQIYPKPHKKYISKVDSQGGFLTEFWSTSNPDRENFVKRNRIVAGMSHATVVIESAEKGGSIITAYLANDYNREVFAVPGRITDKYSAGCLQLIKTQRALPLTQAADIIYNLNWDLKTQKKETIQPQLFLDLNPNEEKIINLLQHKRKELMDEIAISCELPIFKVSSILLNLELKGLIRPLPGKWFELV